MDVILIIWFIAFSCWWAQPNNLQCKSTQWTTRKRYIPEQDLKIKKILPCFYRICGNWCCCLRTWTLRKTHSRLILVNWKTHSSKSVRCNVKTTISSFSASSVFSDPVFVFYSNRSAVPWPSFCWCWSSRRRTTTWTSSFLFSSICYRLCWWALCHSLFEFASVGSFALRGEPEMRKFY